MNREELRQQLISNAEQVMNHPLLWDSMSQEQRNMTIAARQFWSQDNPVVNAALDAFNALLKTLE